MRILNLEMLHLLWLMPVLVGLFILAGVKRRAALKILMDAGVLNRVRMSVSPVRRRWKAALVILSVPALVFALSRPGWNPKSRTVERQGRDVVFLLDVSKSMLAEDLAPNRLERAKLAIADCVGSLEGDRVALVSFAGTAAVNCPLTMDYGFFRMMLEQVSTDSISRGGTLIGDALRKVLSDVFDDQVKDYKDIILITDGEDHDSFPIEAAEAAGKAGVRLLSIGLGDENEGRRIPITDETGRKTFMKYEGQEIWTRLDADTLRKMVNATPGGRYLNVATGTIDLGRVYQDLIATAERRALEAQTVKTYDEKFQIFLLIAFTLLCVEVMVPERIRK